MKIDIYKIQATPPHYLFVEAGKDLSLLSHEHTDKLGEHEFFKSREITEGQKLIGVNSDEILTNIQTQGFHLQSVQVNTQVSEGGAAIGGGILGASIGGPVGALIGAILGYAMAEHAKNSSEEL